MKLLTAQEIKEKKDIKADEQLVRIRKMNDEETAISRKLNQTKADCEAETIRLTEDLTKYEKDCVEKKKVLLSEVTSLEARRVEALKPIDEKLKEVNILIVDVNKKAEEVGIRASDLREAEEKFAERYEANLEKEDDLRERAEGLDRREAGIRAEEARLKDSSESLGRKWADFHSKVITMNMDIERRTKEVEAGRISNEAVAKIQQGQWAEISREKRALHDGRLALEQAKKHLGIE